MSAHTVEEMTMTATTPLQQHGTLPAPGRWTIDRGHSSVEFVARHLMVSKVRGRFEEFTGDLDIGARPEDSSVAVAIAAASVSTGDAQRDGHLASDDFFAAEQFPTINFVSTGVRHVGGERYAVDGDLTVRGVTRPVTLDLEYLGTISDPWGNERVGFSASTEVDREDWGLTWNQALEAGGFLVGKKARIELEVEAVRAA
jgi:polyisoprenoid-binding protein YceI